MMKLYYTPLSPYARKCRVVILEKGLSGQVELIHTPPLDNPPALLSVTPLATVPALVTEDGQALCDSTIICEYLDTCSPEPVLYPGDRRRRFGTLAVAALADGIMDAAVSCVIEGRRPPEKQWGEWRTRKENAIKRTIETLAGEISPDSHQFDIGVINTVVALGYVSFRLPHIEWRTTYRGLSDWFDAQMGRPSLAITEPKG